MKSSLGFAQYDFRGWGVEAQGDIPAPGDYDGDGATDLRVFRTGTGTWFILESKFGFTTWQWAGWGLAGDVLAPADYDGDGRTDIAVYRSSTGEWYVRPSSGAAPWIQLFGEQGDVALNGAIPTPRQLDIVILADETGGMGGAVAEIKALLPLLPTYLSALGDVAIGLSGYRDFPQFPFGDPGDYPYRLLQPVTKNAAQLTNAGNQLVIGGGYDEPESGNEALYQVATGEGIIPREPTFRRPMPGSGSARGGWWWL